MKRIIISILTLYLFCTVDAQTNDSTKERFMAGAGDKSSFSSQDVVISPNPVHNNWFAVELSSGYIREIRILNITGTEVYLRRPDSRVSKFQVYTGKVPDGIYFLKITNSDQISKTYKLMILNQP